VPEPATVLVVDDEIGPRESLRAILKSEYQVLVATEGEQAIRTVEESSVDVVLLDLRMPGVSGVRVMERIKAVDPDIEVILITGYASYETVLEALRLHAFDYISKPFNIAQLRDLVRRAVARRRTYVKKLTAEKEPETGTQMQDPHSRALPVDITTIQKELEGIRAALSQHFHGTLHTLEEGSQELRTRYASQLDAHGKEVLQRMHVAVVKLTQNLEDVLSHPLQPLSVGPAISSSISSANA
jgi:DNA-binding NtrC family response regulator